MALTVLGLGSVMPYATCGPRLASRDRMHQSPYKAARPATAPATATIHEPATIKGALPVAAVEDAVLVECVAVPVLLPLLLLALVVDAPSVVALALTAAPVSADAVTPVLF